MIHIAKKIYMDYQFSPIDRTPDVFNVYIGGLGDSHFPDSINADGYLSLNKFIESHGTFVDAVRYFLSYDRKTILRFLEDDMFTVYAMHLHAIYQDMSYRMFEKFIRLSVLNYKLVHSQISNYGSMARDKLSKIKIPTSDEVKVLFRTSKTKAGSFTSEEKKYVSFEYLLANLFSTEFDENNMYNKEFVSRTNFVMWKSIYWDYVGTRRDILYGLYNIKEFYDIDLDLESPTIDADLDRLKDIYLFSPESGPDNVDNIKANYEQIRTIMNKHNALIKDESFDICNFLSPYMVNGELDIHAIKSLIEEDKKFPSTQLFGRTEFRFNMNNLIVGMIYSGNIKKGGLSL